jgi:enoyl-CoA hydratase/carnithine racemase
MASVETSVADGIFTISFNRPEVHNSFDDEMQDRMLEAFTAARDCKQSRVVIVRGNGRSFTAGRDVTKMGERPEGVSHFEFMMEGTKNIHALLSITKPVIAAVRGGAIGGGCEIAMACDMRIAAPNAKFALPEIDFGLCVDQGGSALASSLIGPSRTKWMLLTGDRVKADQALEWGLVDFIVPDEELDQHVRDLALKIAAKPKLAIAAAKALVNEIWEDDMHAAARREVVQQLALYGSQEFADLREQRRAERAAKAANG